MKINTLVTHKKLKSLGIGCVSKIMSKSVKVNFGTEDVATCKQDMLQEVDVSGCKTVTFADLKRNTLNDKTRDTKYCTVIIGNELRENVGIGYVTLRAVTMDDIKKYPRVID